MNIILFVILLVNILSYIIVEMYAKKSYKISIKCIGEEKNPSIRGRELIELLKVQLKMEDLKEVIVKKSMRGTYNSETNTVHLGEYLYKTGNIKTLWVIVHEFMHAQQKKENHWTMKWASRLLIYKVAIKYVLIPLGVGAKLFLLLYAPENPIYLQLSVHLIGCYGLWVLFHLSITVPKEFDANKRTIEYLDAMNFYQNEEEKKLLKEIVKTAQRQYIAASFGLYKL